APPELLKLFRVTQKLDELLDFILCFLDASDVAKCNFIFVAREHARFRFPEIERAFAGHADLLTKKKVKHEEKKGDREKTDHRLRQNIGFGFNGRLNAGGGEFFLQIACETQIDRGSKGNLLRRR